MKDEEEQEWTKGSTAELAPAEALFLQNYVVKKRAWKASGVSQVGGGKAEDTLHYAAPGTSVQLRNRGWRITR
jgi:hypothetical protein